MKANFFSTCVKTIEEWEIKVYVERLTEDNKLTYFPSSKGVMAEDLKIVWFLHPHLLHK